MSASRCNAAPSDDQSLTIGPDGPILLQDHYLIEQMAMFNRERIPERQPHAKGGGAFGQFEATSDVSKYTVAGERGSPDTWRDPRGFALKFYTSDGNFDMVGNNTPVFFMRDPLKFQHFIRSQKRMAATNPGTDAEWAKQEADTGRRCFVQTRLRENVLLQAKVCQSGNGGPAVNVLAGPMQNALGQ